MAQEKQSTGLAIVARIMKVLKLDEAGKIEKFFAKEIKKFETAIKHLNNNIAAAKNVYQAAVDTLNEKLEDAKEAVENAYDCVTLENLATNDSMTNFSERYWTKIGYAEEAVVALEDQMKKLTEKHEKELKEIGDQIAKREARITKLKG
jgi:phage host-nuclease inhibitor protein Gam